MHDITELSDIQSESGVIGTLIYHPEFILHTDWLKPNHFYETENGCVYWAIQELYNEGITNIDAYNISNKLQSNKSVKQTLDKYNLPAVSEFIDLYKQVARNSVEEYRVLAENVTTLAFKRSLYKTLNEMESQCFDGENLETLNNSIYDKLDELTETFVMTENIRTVGEQIDDIWGEIVDRRTENGLYGIPSKYPILSDYFSYEQGELVVIQAQQKQGKSTFLMNEVAHKLKNGVPTLVVDSEMPTRLYVERLLSLLTGINVMRIKSGDYGDKESSLIQKSLQWIKNQPFVHIYDPTLSNEKLYAMCKMLKHKMDLTFVVYDYLKSNVASSSENYNVLGAKTDFLKNNIAGKLDLAVVAAAQLNRNNEIADSIKINRYASVAFKWGYKTQQMIAHDGVECGNAYAKIYVNRLGQQMPEDDESEYLDFVFDGSKMLISEATQHINEKPF